MDIFDGAGLYAIMFEFKSTSALNQNYELMDIENKNFLLNSGSYFIIMVG